jgi:TonB family protein
VKNTPSLGFLLLALAATPFLLSAKTLEQAYLESFSQTTAFPAPTRVFTPEVDRSAAGKTGTAECVVDAPGNPSSIRITSGPGSRALTAAVTEAVRHGKFRPAEVNGAPVARTVVIPFPFVHQDELDLFVPEFMRTMARKSSGTPIWAEASRLPDRRAPGASVAPRRPFPARVWERAAVGIGGRREACISSNPGHVSTELPLPKHP